MKQQHPITPPPELVQQWRNEGYGLPGTISSEYVATRAAQWGADQELEACRMEIIDGVGRSYIDETRDRACLAIDLWAARRPKPPSLKEQALEAFDCIEYAPNEAEDFAIIRRALESIPDPSR